MQQSEDSSVAFVDSKKLFRFVAIYGWQRTLFKAIGRVRSGHAWWLGRWKPADSVSVGLIGCGQFALATIGFVLLTRKGRCIRACFDLDGKASQSLANALSVPVVASTAAEVLEDPDVDIVYIASNHASHTPYALAALDAGKTVYVEKPISVNWDQFQTLFARRRSRKCRLFSGYNRPFSRAIRDLFRWRSAMSGPLTLACFVSGHQLAADHWYRRAEEGTRVCGNIGHWLDLAVHLLSWDQLPDRWSIAVSWSNPNNRDDDVGITLASSRGDLISIVLTARSEPFEGINETINLQWGEIIAKIDDFRHMTIWHREMVRAYKYRPKDVGHVGAILQPFNDAMRDFSEVEKSTMLMLEITDMVRMAETTRGFSFLERSRDLGIPYENH